MAKVFGIHIVELRPGVKAKDFEEFMIEEGYSLTLDGVEMYLAKGDKGKREGKYVVVLAMDSVEARNRIWGPPGGQGPGLSEEHKEFMAKFGTLATISSWCDYVVVGK